MSFCRVDGVNIFYQVHGRGVPLVFLHGLGSSTEDWWLQIDFFSQNYQVITIDSRGHGRSDKPNQTYDIACTAREVVAVLDKLGLTQAHVVGFSMGGMTAFQLASDQPQRLLSLTIVNSAPAMNIDNWRQKLQFWQRRWLVRLLGMPIVARAIGKRLFPLNEQAHLYQRFVNALQKLPRYAYLQALRSLEGWTVEAQLSRLTMPALVISGDDDYTPVALKRGYSQSMPNAKLVVIKNSRHATPIDQPLAFNLALEGFLSAQNQCFTQLSSVK